MSATLIHHGHIRLIKKAAEYGDVVIGLTTDNEVLKVKGYTPEIDFAARREILLAIQDVVEVVPTPWLITDEVLASNNIDFLVHGEDNNNSVSSEKVIVLPRTKNISSSSIRAEAIRAYTNTNNKKLMLTPGPAVILHENLQGLKPYFGRGDDEFTLVSNIVKDWIKKISGQDHVIAAQGSATFAIELAAHSFLSGKVLLINTGYYSDRIQKLLPSCCHVTVVEYKDAFSVSGNFDWVACAYTETSTAFLSDLKAIKNLTYDLGAKLFVDATGSIGLENNHHLADLTAFSSCKGLFGLTGGCFIAHKEGLETKKSDSFYFNIETHKNSLVTGPYHAIASLYNVIDIHPVLRKRVKTSKDLVMNKFGAFIEREEGQPLLCTYLNGLVSKNDDDIVLYSPRSILPGSVICHFGEIHQEINYLDQRISVHTL